MWLDKKLFIKRTGIKIKFLTKYQLLGWNSSNSYRHICAFPSLLLFKNGHRTDHVESKIKTVPN